MLHWFSLLADWVLIRVGVDKSEPLGEALHFFIEDTSKIFVLLMIMIYLIALARASLRIERVRDYLAGQHRLLGYGLGSMFGAVTPFCSCSSIPLFLGFTSAGIPVGATMAFLLTSPLINEVAIVLLGGLLGWKFATVYILIGMGVGILGGLFLDSIGAERMLQPLVQQLSGQGASPASATGQRRLTLADRHRFAAAELEEILRRVWKWVFIGVGLGAALHGFVPEGWIEQNLGAGQWWTVPTAVLVGIPLYSNATGVIPVMESLILNGLPVGTTLAFCMSTVAASFPEFILLKQVMQWRLLAILFVMLLVSFTLAGWLLNAFAGWVI
ncbi:permease [Aestuariirhabdus litorea]|uniref:Permease n=1 Tax=Aestuariirhabdus litorea TaxID=2528527 RepID=A0A3P3VPM8_9GAMM|nr:permease [Aestuariirhabdus litorea]RRJ84731.1 permease [Aestuariirhabdus litorea]RWW97956.1 permease [Endozoicomonadaceae bacterium GTF-13]